MNGYGRNSNREPNERQIYNWLKTSLDAENEFFSVFQWTYSYGKQKIYTRREAEEFIKRVEFKERFEKVVNG